MIVPGVDLSCDLFKTDPDHHDTGPLLFCNRNSVANNSASFGASRVRICVSNHRVPARGSTPCPVRRKPLHPGGALVQMLLHSRRGSR